MLTGSYHSLWRLLYDILGTYMTTTLAAVCMTCPARFSCTNMDVADVCPAGNYCPGGNGLDYVPCPEGTYR